MQALPETTFDEPVHMSSQNHRNLIEKLATFLSKTEGRDKTCKLLQYMFRFIAAYYSQDSYRQVKYSSLKQSTKDARKIFRLFKSVNECQAMSFILFNEEENFTNLMKIISRLCFFFYWGFDNLSILSKVKLLKFDYERFYTIGYSFWFLALLCMNLTLGYELWGNQQKMLKRNISFDNVTGLPANCNLETKFSIKKIESMHEVTQKQKQRLKMHKWLQFIKNTADLLPSGKDSGVLKIIFNRQLPEYMASAGGFISALISIYQVAISIDEHSNASKKNVE